MQSDNDIRISLEYRIELTVSFHLDSIPCIIRRRIIPRDHLKLAMSVWLRSEPKTAIYKVSLQRKHTPYLLTISAATKSRAKAYHHI